LFGEIWIEGCEHIMDSKITVLISGSGTNLAALLRACNTPALPSARIIRVISNRKAAYGLVRAQEAKVPTTVHSLAEFRKSQPQAEKSPESEAAIRARYDEKLAEIILEDAPDLVVLAGFMHIVSGGFLQKLKAKETPVINLHPALPGAFNGIGAIQRAWDAFQKGEIQGTGLMCHYVIEEVDMGDPICVRKIPMEKGESLEELETRMHTIEWEVIVEGAYEALKARKLHEL
jgi:phosphoribosylglycinamide formyltransferase